MLLQEQLFVRLARWHLVGKPQDPARQDGTRLTRRDVAELTRTMRDSARELIAAAELGRLTSRGNRFNATLGLYHVALYRALRDWGLSDEYAIQLARDIGWVFYKAMTRYLYWLVRPFVWDKQRQINAVIKLLMIFPFSQDEQGYQVKSWHEGDHFRTDWTQCVVLETIKRVGDESDLNFFRNSWCQYDFAFPAIISKDGYYEREHTLSQGDRVCDMKWYARKPTAHSGQKNIKDEV